MSEQNKTVAVRFITAMGSNDPETARACFAPDGRAIAMGTTNFAAAPRSPQDIADGIESFKALLPEGLRFTIGDVTAEGDRVVVEAEGNGVTCEGTSYRNRYCFAFTFADGRIKEVHEYFCTKLADAVLWPLAQAMPGLGKT
jgi:ketosteroid isomerase-like protein